MECRGRSVKEWLQHMDGAEPGANQINMALCAVSAYLARMTHPSRKV